MNSKNIVALEDHSVCMKCLKKEAFNHYHISNRGYGSSFDGCDTYFQVCKDCDDEKFLLWVSEYDSGYNDEEEWCGEKYEYEENILDFIKSLPLQSQELFWNEFAYGACADYGMSAQDWIDFELNELPHEKCKEYHMYSPQEIQAYHDRFPTCNQVFLKVYEDNSSACYCNRQASGNKDGTCGVNISNECYMCDRYETKNDSFIMKTINEREEFYKREKQRLEEMLTYATLRLEKLSNNELEEEY